jgi:hypothetical protein
VQREGLSSFETSGTARPTAASPLRRREPSDRQVLQLLTAVSSDTGLSLPCCVFGNGVKYCSLLHEFAPVCGTPNTWHLNCARTTLCLPPAPTTAVSALGSVSGLIACGRSASLNAMMWPNTASQYRTCDTK